MQLAFILNLNLNGNGILEDFVNDNRIVFFTGGIFFLSLCVLTDRSKKLSSTSIIQWKDPLMVLPLLLLHKNNFRQFYSEFVHGMFSSLS